MRILKLYLLCFTVLILNASQSEDARSTIDKWVETEQIISKEASEWATEKSLLIDTESLLSSELTRLNSALDDLESSVSAAIEERTNLNTKKEKLKSGESIILRSIKSLEESLISLFPVLPEPLLDKIRPVIKRIPQNKNNSDALITERLQNLIVILNQANKFNNLIHIKNELRELDNGKTVQVSTIYLGLASAYYVDGEGEISGIGKPSPQGWIWKEDNSISRDIRKLVDIANGTEAEIEFISVPAEITNL